MPLKNYTTSIDVFKTVGEIQKSLVKHGARKIIQDYDDNGCVKALFFTIKTPNGEQGVRLPVSTDKALLVLKKQGVKCDKAQAERVAWRNIKDWVEAQMALLETEMVSLDEIFLPYMTNAQGQTLYQLFVNQQLQITGGE